MDQLLSVKQVASYLSVSPKTVMRLVARGLRCVRVGRSVRFDAQDVRRWVERQKDA